MSITNAFDNQSEAILNPEHFSPTVAGFPKRCIALFNDKMLKVLRENYDVTPDAFDTMHAGFVIPIYRVNFGGTEIAVYSSTIGASAAVGLFEEILSKGCRHVLFFGSCGVLDKEIAAKHLIIPTEAYRDEGTSYHYAPADNDYIECKNADKLAAIFDELELPYVLGKTWTTDAIYRETRDNMEKRKDEGCVAVDMECSALMAAAQFRKADIYQYFYAADSLDDIEWDARVLGSLPNTAREQYIRIALEVAKRIR
ncbi:MAG: nucleoside phosphorylase [Clostridium sp.]|nr:nucleoside phosphorylase [Clostridium sp.]